MVRRDGFRDPRGFNPDLAKLPCRRGDRTAEEEARLGGWRAAHERLAGVAQHAFGVGQQRAQVGPEAGRDTRRDSI